MRTHAPCKNCEKRHIGCHSTCAEYIDFRQTCESRNLARYNEQDADSYMTDAIRANRRRNKL